MQHRPVLNGISEFCLFSWSKKETCWNKQRKPKGKCSRQAWTWCYFSLSSSPSPSPAADLLCLVDASPCPAGQKEAMDSWWKRCEIPLICWPRVHLRTGSSCEQEEVLAQERERQLWIQTALHIIYTLIFLQYLCRERKSIKQQGNCSLAKMLTEENKSIL